MITDRLVHIEVPRTGSKFFRSLLHQIPGLTIYDPHKRGMHTSYSVMLQDAKEVGLEKMPPAVAFVRHPRSYYVSAWCWITENDYRGLREIPFTGYLEILKYRKITGWPWWSLSEIWDWIGADNATYIFKFERLYGGIRSVILAEMADLISEEEIDGILATAPVCNRSLIYPTQEPLSAHDPATFWTEETIGWAYEWDGKLMERFGYGF